LLVVLYEVLQGAQELLVEDSHFVGPADVCLDQSEDVSPDSLHLLSDGFLLAEFDALRDALRVQAIHPE
jgi:hypothetical protein